MVGKAFTPSTNTVRAPSSVRYMAHHVSLHLFWAGQRRYPERFCRSSFLCFRYYNLLLFVIQSNKRIRFVALQKAQWACWPGGARAETALNPRIRRSYRRASPRPSKGCGASSKSRLLASIRPGGCRHRS